MEDAIDYLFSDEIEADIVALPPDEVDALTDEEDFDGEEIGNAEAQEIAGGLEVEPRDEESDVEEIPESSKAKRQKLSEIKWKRQVPSYVELPFGDAANKNLSNLHDKFAYESSPTYLFEHFFDSEVLDHIKSETNRYAKSKNNHTFHVSEEDLKIFLGFLIFSGYHTLPSEKDYWSNTEDLGIKLVKEAMSKKTYIELKRYLHFQDNSAAASNNHDKGFKVRPLINLVNKKFQQFGVFEKDLSIDEMMVKYFGHHPIKQFIKTKPIRFGYKFWAMCGVTGYCFNFDLYCGRKEKTDHVPKTLGSAVVEQMLSIIEDPNSHCAYFDNYFSSYDLFRSLKEKGFRATGTVRENRTKKCPLKDSKILQKEARGALDYRFDSDNQILFVRWKDNKCVTVGTNFEPVEPFSNVYRWDSEQKKKVAVLQPAVIANYNKYMGGVDHHDWLLQKHCISIRGKKWYWPIFTRVVDMAIVNAYVIHKALEGNKAMSIKDFRRSIATTYLKLGFGKQRSGSLCSNPSKSTVLLDSRFDQKNHIIASREKQRRCQMHECSGKPRTYCKKCDITLCVKCFDPYHDYNLYKSQC